MKPDPRLSVRDNGALRVLAATAVLAVAAIPARGASAAPTRSSPAPSRAAMLQSDASAKEEARTAQTTAEVYAVLHDGGYAGLTLAKLDRLEPTLRTAGKAKLVAVSGHTTGFSVTVRAAVTRQTFSISLKPSGKVVRTCTGQLECARGVW